MDGFYGLNSSFADPTYYVDGQGDNHVIEVSVLVFFDELLVVFDGFPMLGYDDFVVEYLRQEIRLFDRRGVPGNP
jgi:hypothetical protein